ncbi:MAG TPA: VWA domain-containing protein [Bryobacteraceae bacterium]|nr:VWA domain-containing protein [Bryobacteraceae bacterium]
MLEKPIMYEGAKRRDESRRGRQSVCATSAWIVAFCRYARTHGLSTGVTETLAALEAVRALSDARQESLQCCLRAVLCSSKEEWELFDGLFAAFRAGESQPQAISESAQDNRRPRHEHHQPGQRGFRMAAGSEGRTRAREDGEVNAVSGAGMEERLTTMDFSQVPPGDQATLEALALRLLKRASIRLSRRLRISGRAGRVDVRRTIRRSVCRGGEPFDLSYRQRKREQARLVLFLDVSGSMNLYSLFLLRFAHALQKHFRRADTFIFSTGLVEITRELRSRQLPAALEILSRRPAGWAGGTRIGESLRDFNRRYARKSLRRDTFFIVLSDGWDTGEPALLASELQAVKRRVRKLVWLNPLLGLEGYQPLTRGMAAALPYVDTFAPAHSLESLLALEKHLR